MIHKEAWVRRCPGQRGWGEKMSQLIKKPQTQKKYKATFF